jgi:hypothetical protein
MLLLATALAGCGDDAVPDGGGPDAGTDAAPEDAGIPPSPCDEATEARIETVAMLEAGRYSPAAALLEDGRVLVAGGYDFTRGIQAGAELFDPATGTLEPTGMLGSARNFPATVAMPDGSVLVVGGFHPSFGSLRTVERYRAGAFEYLDAMMDEGREAHTATLLDDGTVLVAGGLQAIGFVFHRSAEVLDPAGALTPTAGPMTVPRAFHAAVRLASGEVLVVGGDSGMGELATAERYVPSSRTFVLTAGPRARRGKAVAAVLLADGRVLVTGGASAEDGTLADADVYDGATDRFEPVEPMSTRRMAHALVTLGDGRVLASGGWSDSSPSPAAARSLEVFDPSTGTWETLPVELAEPRLDHVAILLPDCRVLIAGGQRAAEGEPPRAPTAVELVTIPSR